MEESRLEYLCIYNPDLDHDESIQDQLVFAYNAEMVDEQINLRRIGLAQGVVVFGRGFADNETVSTLETTQSRLVIKEIETGWWVVACALFSKLPTEGGGVEYNNRELSTAEIMSAEIDRAYRRWRLHYGLITDYMNKHGIEELKENLRKWWHAWCEYWTVDMNNDGSVGLWDAIKYSKGEISDKSKQIVTNTLDKHPQVKDMIITRYDREAVGNCGCIWAGDQFSTDSIDDVVRWVLDCEDCEDEAFLDDTGFVYNYQKDAFEDELDGDDVITHSRDWQDWQQTVNATMDQLIGRMKSMSSLWGAANKPEHVETQPESEDIAESKYLIGTYTLDNEDEGATTTINKKQICMQLSKGDGEFGWYNIVVYRRRPFTFVLVYDPEEPALSRVDHYAALQLRLASLVEPLSLDLYEQINPESSKFYFIVYDPTKKTIRGSMPRIPRLSIRSDDENAQQTVMDRLDLIHVHQAVASLVTEWYQGKIGGKEHERFVRTSRNWWVYFCKLPDEREAVFARRWTKNSSPQGSNTNNNLLAVLGTKEAKQWLDNYKHYDRV